MDPNSVNTSECYTYGLIYACEIHILLEIIDL